MPKQGCGPCVLLCWHSPIPTPHSRSHQGQRSTQNCLFAIRLANPLTLPSASTGAPPTLRARHPDPQCALLLTKLAALMWPHFRTELFLKKRTGPPSQSPPTASLTNSWPLPPATTKHFVTAHKLHFPTNSPSGGKAACGNTTPTTTPSSLLGMAARNQPTPPSPSSIIKGRSATIWNRLSSRTSKCGSM